MTSSNRLILGRRLLAIVAASLLIASSARAQAQEGWLSRVLARTAANSEATEARLAKAALEPLEDYAPRVSSLERYSPRVSEEAVDLDVDRFADRFLRGADDPETYLNRLEGNHADLRSRWLDTPKQRRVFVIGRGQDRHLAAAVRDELEKEGYSIFFYQFCADTGGMLCPPEAVGAFFKTSGRTFVLDTSAARTSPYVTREAEIAFGLQSAERLHLFDSEELLNAMARYLPIDIAGQLIATQQTEAADAPTEYFSPPGP